MQINRNQIYKYAGYGSKRPAKETVNIIELGIEELQSVMTPKWTGQAFPLKEMEVVPTGLRLAGQSASELLKTSHEVVFLATTLGAGVDRWIQRKTLEDLSLGFLWDAIASAAAESFIEEVDYELRLRYGAEGLYLTDRFSPGYGDLPIDFSKSICQLLDSERKIGMYFSPSGLLMPRKSITAFLGVSRKRQAFREKTCEDCLVKKDCKFRQKGVICHESHS